jgi:hypothetical protein
MINDGTEEGKYYESNFNAGAFENEEQEEVNHILASSYPYLDVCPVDCHFCAKKRERKKKEDEALSNSLLAQTMRKQGLIR